MPKTDIRHIILSEKPWHRELVDQLNKENGQASFILINKKQDFNVPFLETINPEKIFIPH